MKIINHPEELIRQMDRDTRLELEVVIDKLLDRYRALIDARQDERAEEFIEIALRLDRTLRRVDRDARPPAAT